MKKATALYGISLSKNIAFSALFAALCCVGTTLIVVPLPYGYFNAGDIFVLLAGWCLGPLYGPIAAAVGSCLADLWSGFALYAPVTFAIKGVDALLAWLVWRALKKFVNRPALDFLPRALGAIVGEAIMVLGYFLFESALYGFAGGAAALLGNTLQGVFCGVCAVALAAVLTNVRSVKRLFPALGAKEE